MKFRKKPVVIEAVQFEYSEEGIQKIKDFCGENAGYFVKERHPAAVGEFVITTLEDGVNLKAKHVATEGDWIIKGIKGEFYACKPDIFEATYDKMVDDADESIEFQSISHQLDWYKNMCAKYAADRLNEGKRLQDTMATVNELMTKIFELKSELAKYQPNMGNSYNEG